MWSILTSSPSFSVFSLTLWPLISNCCYFYSFSLSSYSSSFCLLIISSIFCYRLRLTTRLGIFMNFSSFIKFLISFGASWSNLSWPMLKDLMSILTPWLFETKDKMIVRWFQREKKMSTRTLFGKYFKRKSCSYYKLLNNCLAWIIKIFFQILQLCYKNINRNLTNIDKYQTNIVQILRTIMNILCRSFAMYFWKYCTKIAQILCIYCPIFFVNTVQISCKYCKKDRFELCQYFNFSNGVKTRIFLQLSY